MGTPSKVGMAKAIRETRAALLVKLLQGPKSNEPFWVPRVVIHDDSEVYKFGHEGMLVVEDWWAERNADKLG